MSESGTVAQGAVPGSINSTRSVIVAVFLLFTYDVGVDHPARTVIYSAGLCGKSLWHWTVVVDRD